MHLCSGDPRHRRPRLCQAARISADGTNERATSLEGRLCGRYHRSARSPQARRKLTSETSSYDSLHLKLTSATLSQCVDDCESWNGGTKSQCQQCCSQTKQRTGQWTCNETFSNPPPGPGPQPPMPPQCGASCSSNYECASLGDNQPPGSEWCGECNLVHGTRGFGTCYNASDDDNDDFVQPWTYPGGVGYTCATQCNNNSDCQEGGFDDCGTCNKEHGTEGYNTCINPPENESTVALA